MDRNLITIFTLLGGGLLGAVSIGYLIRTPSDDAKTMEKIELRMREPNAPERPATPPDAYPTPRADRVPHDFSTVDNYLQIARGVGIHDWEVGSGPVPGVGQHIMVEYSLFLTDGTLIESTLQTDDAFVYVHQGGETLPGFEIGTASMRVGGRRQILIPGEAGYGSRGKPPVIPPNTTLIYEVELLGVMPPRDAPEAPAEVPGYTKTESGLEYHDLVVGTGHVVQDGYLALVDYSGWFENGDKFDSSYDRAQPITVGVGEGRVLPGWEEGLVGMRVGGKRQLRIPPELAFGKKGRAPLVPPDSTMIFELEVKHTKPDLPPGAPPPDEGAPPPG